MRGDAEDARGCEDAFLRFLERKLSKELHSKFLANERSDPLNNVPFELISIAPF